MEQTLRLPRPMNISSYLTRQFKNFNGVLHHIAGDLTEAEWLSRPAPGQNTLGYSVWHVPRTQDHYFHRWIQSQAEIVENGRWEQWSPLKPLGIGVGITMEESDKIAYTATLTDTLAYADEVHQAILTWFEGVDEGMLDFVPNAQAHLKQFPEYQTPGYLEEISDLFDLPVWGLLIRPCMGHLHRHLGEVEITKDILRKRVFESIA